MTEMNNKYTHTISFAWVKDWDNAVDFYRLILGLKKVYESDGWAEFSLPGIQGSYLALNRWSAEGTAPQNEFVTLGVADVAQFKKHLEANNVKIKSDIVTFEGEKQGMRMFKFFDSEGNILTAAETFDC